MAKTAKIKSKGKILCAMSGGVDSSVAAALLLKQGYEVIGVFMKFWHPGESVTGGENVCCSSESYREAQKVARVLGIKLYTLNFEKPFKKLVVDDFLSQYQQGQTPNPCIRCNEKIKFGLLLVKARQLKIPLVATGHYAQVKKVAGRVELRRGRDRQKDQSYFLYRLTPAQLRYVIFPVGRYTKPQVRQMAAKFFLPTATRRESQEVCFVPGADTRSFLKKYLKMKPGLIVSRQGESLGRHEGLPLYTLGQRRGVVGGLKHPYFVCGKDAARNTLVVTDQPADLLSDTFTVGDLNWISAPVKFPFSAKVKIRYGAPASMAVISRSGPRVSVKFKHKQRAVTPGQSAVFYQGEKILGGGIIDEGGRK